MADVTIGNQIVKQLVVVEQTDITTNQHFQQVALFNADGTPLVINQTAMEPAAAQSDFVGADLTALKVELNAFLAKLEAAGIVAS